MVIVEQDIFGSLKLSFKYYPDYIDRVKSLNARFNSEDKSWVIGADSLDKLIETFKGELFFKTPEWEIRGTKPPDYSDLYKFNVECEIEDLAFKLKPFNYQEFGIKFLVDRLESDSMAFIADDVGLGKTIQAIGSLKYLYNENAIKDTVIVCKKSLKYQWQEEINKFINFDGDIYIADDNKKKRFKAYDDIKNSKKNTILIINYHLLLKDSDYIKSDFVIFDEVHTAKKPGGELNKNCAKITKNASYCLFMTGTPIMSRPDDMYGIISIKDKKYFGKYKDFEDRYITKYYNGKYVNVVGYKNLDELRDKMQRLILRRTSEEVSIDLPEIVYINKPCDLDGKQEGCLAIASQKTIETEQRLEQAKEKYKKNKSPNVKQEIERLEGALKGFIAVEQAIANSPVLFHYSKSKGVREVYKDLTPSPSYLSSKMQTLLDICDDIKEGQKKVVIFTKYETVVSYINDLLNRNGIKSTKYTGTMSDEERNKSIQEFKYEDDVTAIIGTDALAEGVDTLALVS